MCGIVIDVLRIGDKLSVTLEGVSNELRNGTDLIDKDGTFYKVISVAMTRNNNPSDISKSTTILISDCNIKIGDKLIIA